MKKDNGNQGRSMNLYLVQLSLIFDFRFSIFDVRFSTQTSLKSQIPLFYKILRIFL